MFFESIKQITAKIIEIFLKMCSCTTFLGGIVNLSNFILHNFILNSLFCWLFYCCDLF